MARALRPIGHEDRLSIVDHLDELRTRLIVCGATLVVAFAVCFWQNHALLSVLNRALPHSSTVASQSSLANLPRQETNERAGLVQSEHALQALSVVGSRLSSAERQLLSKAATGLGEAARALPHSTPPQVKPITIGIGEPFTTTLTVAAYFALLFSLPVLIYQGYAFVIPALNPKERRVAIPVMAAAPLLFVMGVAFTYAVVLPPAVHFLQGYNSSKFDILVQAKAYYTFEIMTMLGIGLAFQLPLGLLGLDAIGAINSSTLTRHWRYAVVIIAVIAAALPGADPVTTALEMLPLVLLYVLSIVLLKFADRRAAARAAAEFDSGAVSSGVSDFDSGS
jgi:sec-independent protein translocase protein TatC